MISSNQPQKKTRKPDFVIVLTKLQSIFGKNIVPE